MSGPTTEEHFVPRGYLRFFCCQKEHLYLYDVQKNKNLGLVSIKTLFKKHNLYELRDDNGEFVNRNEIEHRLNHFETEYLRFIKALENRAIKEADTRCVCDNFLSDDDVNKLRNILAIQVCRGPEFLNDIKQAASNKIQKSRHSHKISANTAQRWTFDFCLPPNNHSVGILPNILKLRLILPCAIGYCESGEIITSDRPYNMKHNKHAIKHVNSQIGTIVFPLTSKLVLCFYPWKLCREKNLKLFRLTERDVLEINRRIASNSNYLCSKFKFTDEKISIILNKATNI